VGLGWGWGRFGGWEDKPRMAKKNKCTLIMI
jgi:hypothetical protein